MDKKNLISLTTSIILVVVITSSK